MTLLRPILCLSSVLLVALAGCEGTVGDLEPSQSSVDQSPAALVLGATEVTMRPQETLQLAVGVNGGQGVTLATMAYESLTPAVATVSGSGFIQALAVGSTTIRVTATFLPQGTTSRADLLVRVAAMQAPRIALTGAPAASTTATNASISWTVTGAQASSVRCRLDAYAPVACPNPFAVGASTPLARGAHRVDFWVDDGTTGLDLTQPLASAQWTVVAAPPPPSIQLTGVPTASTTQTSASIGYQVVNPAGGETVHCRLDAYAPIACPNPFQLGAVNPLAAGPHTVDFYLVPAGATVDPAQATLRVSWTITGSTVTTPPSTALPLCPLPVATAVSGSNATWDGVTPIVVNGVQAMAPVTDPNGSGRTVNLHRVTQGGSLIWGGVRSEQVWHSRPDQALTPGKDFWMSFAVQRKPDETFGSTTSYDEHLIFQTHTPQSGNTQPDIALFASGQTGLIAWRVAYNTSGTVDSQGWMNTEGNPWVHQEALPTPGVWYRYVVHYRPGYQSSHNPLLEIWRAKPGAAYEKLVTHTGFNTYNTSRTGAGASYPRIGLYKYSTWTSPTVAWYLSPLYFGSAADLLEAGKASLNGL